MTDFKPDLSDLPDKSAEIRASKIGWLPGVNLFIVDRLAGIDRKARVGTVVMNEMPISGQLDAAIRLDERATQLLMDELWIAGFRPSEGTGSAGALRAVENHLDDLRRLVAKTLKVDFGGRK